MMRSKSSADNSGKGSGFPVCLRRALLNGKLDLAQAEAIADLIDAGTAAAARAAERSLQGEWSRRGGEIQAQLIELRVHVEAAIDFPDEDIDSLGNPAIASRLQRIFASFDALATAARPSLRSLASCPKAYPLPWS